MTEGLRLVLRRDGSARAAYSLLKELGLHPAYVAAASPSVVTAPPLTALEVAREQLLASGLFEDVRVVRVVTERR